MLKTQDPLLQRLPWHELQIYERDRSAEIGICALDYQQAGYQSSRSTKVRILAVIGDATGLNTQIDQALLQNLPEVDIHFLKEPNRETLNRFLWDAKGRDILFLAAIAAAVWTVALTLSKAVVKCGSTPLIASPFLSLNTH